MGITFFSLLTTQFVIGILIAILIPLSKNNKFICQFGIYFAMAPLIACIFRLVVPIETLFTIVLHSENILPSVYLFGRNRLNLNVIISIWIVVSFVLFIRLIRDMQTLKALSKSSGNEYSTAIEHALEQVMQLRGYKKQPRIIAVNEIVSPFVFGYKEPLIYIPDIEYTEEQLFYILDHELGHWHNKDLWMKLCVQFVCIIYWWNPATYLLRDMLAHSMEIKCDFYVCKGFNAKQKTEYLDTLLYILENMPESKINYSLVTSNFISYMSDSHAIAQRFQLVYQYKLNDRKKRMAYVLGMVMFVLSYSVVFQPVYEPCEEDYLDGDGADIVIVDGKTLYVTVADNTYYVSIGNEEAIEMSKDKLDALSDLGIKIIFK